RDRCPSIGKEGGRCTASPAPHSPSGTAGRDERRLDRCEIARFPLRLGATWVARGPCAEEDERTCIRSQRARSKGVCLNSRLSKQGCRLAESYFPGNMRVGVLGGRTCRGLESDDHRQEREIGRAHV